MFRTEATQDVSLGAQYDHPTTAIRSRHWVLLFGVGIAVICAGAWACLAEVPVSVQSHGILLRPSGVEQVQSLSYGEVVRVHAGRNESLQRGAILLELRIPSLNSELELAQGKLNTGKRANDDAILLESQQLEDEKSLAEEKRKQVQIAVAELQEIVDRTKKLRDESVKQQRTRLTELSQKTARLLEQLVSQRESVHQLVTDQLATQSDQNKIDAQVLESFKSATLLSEQESTIAIRELESDQSELEIEQRIQNLKLSMNEVDLSLKRLEKKFTADRLQREAQLATLDHSVQELQRRYEVERFVRCACNGSVLELPIEVGQTVRPAQVVATIAKSSQTSSNEHLRVTAFFSLADGKKIRANHQAFVTPTTVERERHGSIRASVSEVYSFPMSAQEALRLVGNQEVLTPVLKSGGLLGVHAELEQLPGSVGYAWTSQLEPPELSAGTMVTIQVVVERRRPISYLVPFLRRQFYGPDRPAKSIP